ncbi:MAG TPA: imidazole glycerol phosphate synthase subunit HisH [Longimicrobiales bacterium]|nr:imidazole glycerol phosphate synthase subunit HisH [Trueperaceae bacterium]HKJ92537.1 imidazole glycerol phosphate synthase subunit HisH [Longimicrobiales bacterium]
MRTVLIDYGASNLHSVERALQRAGLAAQRVADPGDAAGADVLVLPGQGHFGQVMRAFRASGFEPLVRAHVAAGRPFLGICVGLQLLLEASEEAPDVPGLGLLPGTARRFPAGTVSVPHMGWNQIARLRRPALLQGIDDGAFVYFAHSYYVAFDDLDVPGAVTEYGGVTFKSAISRGALHATQFHPEKSQAVGLRVLENFARLAADAVEA